MGSPATTSSRLIVLNASTLIERDADFTRFAARILLSYVYEEVLDWRIDRDGVGALRAAHVAAFRSLLERGVACGRIDAQLLGYDLDRLAAAIDPTADLDFDFLGVQTLYDRYLIVDKTGVAPVRLETPQLFWLRVAMGVCLGETSDREARVLALYDLYKCQRRFCSSTPTLFNAGTPHSQLSSCYLYIVDDSLESIMQRGIAENAMCSKWAGGLGGSWTAVRGTGSHIRGTNGESQGVMPFLKLHNDQLVAVNQGGKRAGSGLRLPRDLAQRHPRLPRAAPQHRRRAPPHARHEHGELDPRPVHEARGGARALDALPQLPMSATCTSSTAARSSALRGATRRAPPQGKICERANRRARPLEADAADALRDRASLDHVQGPVQRPQPAGPRRRRALVATSAPRSRSTRATTRPRSATSARSCSTST